MRFVSMRRALPAGMAAAAVVALGVPGVASAKAPKTDVLEQCSGAAKIESEGSTFQAPADFFWTGVDSDKSNEALKTGFNFSSYKLACAGKQGSHAEPEVYYNQENGFNRGSGSCLKTWGNGVSTFGENKGGEVYPRVKKFPICGTDEAPNEAVKKEFEKFAGAGVEGKYEYEPGKSQEGAAIESIPVAQGSEAIVVHLPKGCLATSEIVTSKGKKEKLGRLALDQDVVAGIYEGTIKTWAEALSTQGGDGNDTLTCKSGGENDTIRPVVREDKSGTTHIFKAFLEQVSKAKIPMEEFKEVKAEGVGTGEVPCTSGELGEGAEKTWENVAEGCENQRWPLEAKVLRPKEQGNPGVVKKVNETESSVGYADLAVAQEYKFFNPGEGGEKSKGEQHEKFWAVVQNSKPGASPVTFEDPSTDGDTAKEGNSNCKESKYISAPGTTFPPSSTRLDWSKVKASNVSQTYPICGVTYILAARQYWYFLEKYGVSEEESKKIATTVHDFVQFVVAKAGGGKVLKNHDYEALPSSVVKEALLGAEEIGSKEG